MIVFDILCAGGHRFEGWFGSSADYESQRKRRLVVCPVCNSEQVDKVPSATRINVGAAPVVAQKTSFEAQPNAAPASADAFAIAQQLYSKMLDELIRNTEDLGTKFPDEARKIYYKEAPARPIRGVASQEEHDSLVDEGIPVARIPIPTPDRMN